LRPVLLVVIVVEALCLAGTGAFVALGDLDAHGREPPPVPVFRPPIHEAVIGDAVRYQITRDGQITGYVEYEVVYAVEITGTNLGREFVVRITPFTKGGRAQSGRLMRIRPRAVRIGFLPPRIEEDDDYPSGARPVIKTIRTERFRVQRREVDGFLVEAVTPRVSLTEVSERYWMTEDVPVFGVARWQRADEDLTLHSMRRGKFE
jgi:hypothetical protein